MQEAKIANRRRHAGELKRRVLDECAQPGASVARVALANGLNANLVHKWRREARPAPAGLGSTHDVGPEPRFIAVTLPPAVQRTAAEVVQLELRRDTLTVNCTWPVSSMSQCAAWLREILR